jgi:hypothetical protein
MGQGASRRPTILGPIPDAWPISALRMLHRLRLSCVLKPLFRNVIVLPDFADLFRTTYSALGRPLTRRDAMPLSRIRAAERRLGVVVPKVLRDYYRVAGKETQFNAAFNRLLPPEEWFVDRKRLVFFEENQQVVYWAIPATFAPDARRRTPDARRISDPPVYQGINGDPIAWYKEHDRTSTFLIVHMHWHGAFAGALPATATALTSVGLRKRLRKTWHFVGEVNHMQAFSKPGKTVCHLNWEDGCRVFAGALSKPKLDEIGEELELRFPAPIGEIADLSGE